MKPTAEQVKAIFPYITDEHSSQVKNQIRNLDGFSFNFFSFFLFYLKCQLNGFLELFQITFRIMKVVNENMNL